MTPQIEKVNPAGVNNDGYFAEISGIDWLLIGNVVDKTLQTMTMKKAAILPPQSLMFRVIFRYRFLITLRQAECREFLVLNAKQNWLRSFAIDIDLGVEGYARQAMFVFYR